MTRPIDKIILGTVQYGIPYGINNGSGVPPRVEIDRLLEVAYEKGVRTLDTADAYGTALAVIADFHQSHPSVRFRVHNKFSGEEQDLVGLGEKLRRQLDRLQIDAFDHYLIHNAEDIANDYLIEALLNLKEMHVINNIGISIYTNQQFAAANDAPYIDSIQVPYNLLDNNIKRAELIRDAKTRGKEVHARSVFLQGLFFVQEERLPAKLKPLSSYLKKLEGIAGSAGMTMTQLALQYVLQNEHVDRVLIGADNTQQLEANLEAISTACDPGFIELVDKINVQEEDLLSPVNWH